MNGQFASKDTPRMLGLRLLFHRLESWICKTKGLNIMLLLLLRVVGIAAGNVDKCTHCVNKTRYGVATIVQL
jgi:hypothetical protein